MNTTRPGEATEASRAALVSKRGSLRSGLKVSLDLARTEAHPITRVDEGLADAWVLANEAGIEAGTRVGLPGRQRRAGIRWRGLGFGGARGHGTGGGPWLGAARCVRSDGDGARTDPASAQWNRPRWSRCRRR